jgi:hypothetical protein
MSDGEVAGAAAPSVVVVSPAAVVVVSPAAVVVVSPVSPPQAAMSVSAAKMASSRFTFSLLCLFDGPPIRTRLGEYE